MPDFVDGFSTDLNQGFEATGFFPVTREKLNRTIIEVDCVMVRPT